MLGWALGVEDRTMGTVLDLQTCWSTWCYPTTSVDWDIGASASAARVSMFCMKVGLAAGVGHHSARRVQCDVRGPE